MSNGGKLILSTGYEIKTQDISKYFKTNSIVEANTTFQPLEILKQIGKTYVSERIIKENAKEIFLKSTSIRACIGHLIAIDAKEQLNLTTN